MFGYDTSRTTLRVVNEDPFILTKKLTMDTVYQRWQTTGRAPIDGASIASIDGHLAIFQKCQTGNSLTKTMVV